MTIIATSTEGRLGDFSLLDKTPFLLLAILTDECCLFHFRNNVTATNYDASESNQLFNVSWVKLSDSVNLS
jgi:hypothetical protein